MDNAIFDSGAINVLVPTGWKAFHGIDSEGKSSPKNIHITKGAQTELDVFSKPRVTVFLHEKSEIYVSSRSFYSDVQDIEPFELGGFLWEGFMCNSRGIPYTMLETQSDCGRINVSILTENNGQKISLDDSDVRKIIASIDVYTD